MNNFLWMFSTAGIRRFSTSIFIDYLFADVSAHHRFLCGENQFGGGA